MPKLSAREEWSAKTGLPKEQYPGGGSSSGGSKKKSSYSEFMIDTKPVEKAYNKATDFYLNELSSLKPRYEKLYQDVEAQRLAAVQADTTLAGTEDTQQKTNIAKRGIAVTEDNQFFTEEVNKQDVLQNQRQNQVNIGFNTQKLGVETAQSQDERDIQTQVANLKLAKTSAINDILRENKSTKLTLKESKRAQDNADREFNYKKLQDEIARSERAAAISRAASSEIKSKNTKYNSTLADLVGVAYDTPGNTPYERERIQTKLKAAFPDLASQIDKDIAKFFPNGWESGKSNVSKPATPIKEIGEWVYYDDGTRENISTGEIQRQQ